MIALKPFLKWAGGKTQLLSQLQENYPNLSEIKSYYEPFLGGGAVFFDLVNCDTGIEKFYLSDINPDLILTYKIVQQDVGYLIKKLGTMQGKYLQLSSEERKAYFYDIRDRFNHYGLMDRASPLLIFLNKTCFNGLYRVNKKGEFNVPFGDYKNPKILDIENLEKVSTALKGVSLEIAGFEHLLDCDIDESTFIYFDPPYRPVSKSSSFTAYSGNFDDDDQIKLSQVFRDLDRRGAKLMLSNSDTDDGFYERYYAGFNIHKVTAKRMINCVGKGRGMVNEVLIKNY